MKKKPKGYQAGGLINPPGGLTRIPKASDVPNTPVARGTGYNKGGKVKKVAKR